MLKRLVPAVTAAVALLALASTASAQNEKGPQGERGPNVPEFWVRPGYKVTLAADARDARFMQLGPDGVLYVGDGTGKAIRTFTPNPDGTYTFRSNFVEGLDHQHGFQLADDGYLYYTVPNAIYRVKPTGDKAANIETVLDNLPIGGGRGGHWYRPVLVKDGYLWTAIGDPSNASDQTNTDREKIWRYKTDGTDKTLWCTGIRNTEKLLFRPGTAEMYGCDHGSDNIGANYGENNGGPVTDKFPPDEFNRYIQGFNYGHPFVTGLGMPRPEYAKRPDILQLVDNNTPPAWCFGAHNASCGWTFTTKPALTGQVGDAIIALHGSWNSRTKVGYKVARVIFDDVTHKPIGEQPLVTTLDATGTSPLARPVDIIELPDGSILFSDDHGGKIYKLTKL
jgi:glucose/arabinose dehydrogenase